MLEYPDLQYPSDPEHHAVVIMLAGPNSRFTLCLCYAPNTSIINHYSRAIMRVSAFEAGDRPYARSMKIMWKLRGKRMQTKWNEVQEKGKEGIESNGEWWNERGIPNKHIKGKIQVFRGLGLSLSKCLQTFRIIEVPSLFKG